VSDGKATRPARYAGRIEDLLTERPTLAIPRLRHNAQADLLRKQQVLGSNPSVGSNTRFGSGAGAQIDPDDPSMTIARC
jgi:hypothetical protein